MQTSKTEEKNKITVVNEDEIKSSRNTGDVEGLKVTVINEAWVPFLKSRFLTFIKKPAGILAVAALSFLLGYSIPKSNQAPVSLQVNNGNIEYQKLNNAGLRAAGLDLSSDIRKFLLRWGVKEQQINLQVLANITNAKSEMEQEKIWQDYMQTSTVISTQRRQEFETMYQGRINKFRQELFKRLNKPANYAGILPTPENPNEWRNVMENVGELTEQFLEP